ncbi:MULTISPECIES: portal protein [unclassified Shinella]|nr:phage portal protein [Shinella sp. YE25]MDC7256436.1 phage portal protein [Shinella sp. YE25]CAI0339303.1 conserved hypothetical protein [Rhizobiaceae bacterium]CAK7257712.1 Phage portal protein [Shinella sp. WSC3-e]
MTGLAKGKPVPQRFKDWFINDRNHTEKWREEAKEDYEFVAGRQYSDDEIAALKAKKRPIVVFNRIQPIVDSVYGQEIGNRRQVSYIPREMGDVKPNELMTGAAEWFRDQAHAETHESDAFLDMLICGIGWTETRIDMEENPAGTPEINRVDPMEMFWDYDAKRRNLSDARRVWRARRIPVSEAKAMFPGFAKAQLDAQWTMVRDRQEVESAPETDDGGEDSGDELVTLVHAQWIEREAYYIAEDPMSGQQGEFSVEEYQTTNKRMKQLMGTEMQGARLMRKVRKQAFLGEVVLSYGPAPCPTQFSFVAITGKRDRNKGTWYGLVRGMKDPQRWANKWLSQMMHIMNSNAKGGLLAEKGAFRNQRQAEESWADPSAITWMEDGSIQQQRIKEKPPAQFPAGFQQLTEFAISSIRDTSGVSVEMLGLREAGQAASLEMQRRQAGMTILQPFFDALKHYRELQGAVMLYYIQNDLSDGRLVKIVGDDNAQYVPLIRQATSEYDIIIDDAPTSPNMKEAAWATMMQLLPAFGQMIPPQMMVTLLEYSPLPSNVVEKLKQQAQQRQEQQAQAQQQQMQVAQQREGAEVGKIESETEKNRATALNQASQVEFERARMATDMLQMFAAPQGQPERAIQ